LTELLRHSSPGAALDDVRRRLERFPQSDRLLLATDGETLIGYAHLRVVHDLLEEDTVELVAMVVAPADRRKGIGRRLIAAAETWALQSGRARLRARAEVVSSQALAFFAALGYRRTSTSQGYERDLESARRAEAPTQPH
jgi:GNAT superfamily N-acetyltransferase